jgi:hypothetical protein
LNLDNNASLRDKINASKLGNLNEEENDE